MCRLLAWAHSGPPSSPLDTLGGPVWDAFQDLSRVHRDGWGAAWYRAGAPSSYRTTTAAHADGFFADVISAPLDALIVHERWASPGIALSLDNQQPFTSGPLAFAHNGTIGNEQGNIVGRPSDYRRSLGLEHSVTRSDSQIYAQVFFHHLAQAGFEAVSGVAPTVDQVHRALTVTLAALRRDYPDASFNNVILTPDYTFATRAHAQVPRHGELLRRGYEKAGWTHRLADYYELKYTTLRGEGVTSVVSSSGYEAADGWSLVENNSLVALCHRSGEVEVHPLRGEQ